jgi:hypothetical protein
MKEEILLARQIAKEIINTEFLEDKDLKRIMNKFYKIMRKHGIKQGTWNKEKTYRNCDEFEWTMFKELFISRVKSQLDFSEFLLDIPKDLQGYNCNK